MRLHHESVIRRTEEVLREPYLKINYIRPKPCMYVYRPTHNCKINPLIGDNLLLRSYLCLKLRKIDTFCDKNGRTRN